MPLRALVATLDQMTEAHEELIQMGKQKRDVIVQDDIDGLNQIVLKESKMIKRIAELEQKRQFEVDRYVVGKGYRPNPSITISEITKLVFKAEDKKAMLESQARLTDALTRLKQVHDLNKQLLEHSLFFVEYSLNLMTGSSDDEAVYSHPDQRNVSYRNPGFFDTRT